MEAFVELGFSRNITFDNRAMARGEFIRFIRLAFLLDFISVEALGNMVVANIEHLKTALYSGVSESLELPQGLSFGVT